MKLVGIAAGAATLLMAASSGYAQTTGNPSSGAPPAYPMNGWMMGPQGMTGQGMMGQGMMGPGMMQGYGAAGGPWMMGANGPGGWDCSMMTANAEGRLAYLKSAIKITPEQETLWKAYADASRDAAQGMVGHCMTMMSWNSQSLPSLPERLDLHEQLMGQRLDAIKATNKALKPLYGALTADQKKLADQMLWGPMGMM